MKIIARLIAAFLGWEGVAYAVAIAAATFLQHFQYRLLIALFDTLLDTRLDTLPIRLSAAVLVTMFFTLFLPLLILVAMIQVGRRIAAIGGGGPWRMVPDGDLMFARALFALVLAVSLLYGPLAGWADINNHFPVFGHSVLIYLTLSCFAQVLLLSRGRRLSKIAFIAVCCFAVPFDSYNVFQLRHAARGVTWPLTEILFTIGWLIAIFRAPRYRARVSGLSTWRSVLQSLSVGLRGWRLRLGSPAHNILQTERRGLGKLTYALLFIFGCAYLEHWTASKNALLDNYWLILSVSACTVAITTLFAASGVTPRARLLWLRCADSRAQMFRICEKSALRQLLAVSFFAWAIVTGLALQRETAIDPREALLMLPACFAGGIATLYIGLTQPILRGWGFYLSVAVAIVVIVFIPISWTVVFDMDLSSKMLIRAVNLGVSLSVCIGLRAFALWRWRKIDWAQLRPVPSPRFARLST